MIAGCGSSEKMRHGRFTPGGGSAKLRDVATPDQTRTLPTEEGREGHGPPGPAVLEVAVGDVVAIGCKVQRAIRHGWIEAIDSSEASGVIADSLLELDIRGQAWKLVPQSAAHLSK